MLLTDIRHTLSHAEFRDDRSILVVFRGAVPPEVQARLDEFSEAHDIPIEVVTGAGYSAEEFSDAVPRVHYAIYCIPGVVVRSSGSGENRGEIVSTVILTPDGPSLEEVQRIAEEALQSGPHEGMWVLVKESEYVPPVIDPFDEGVCTGR